MGAGQSTERCQGALEGAYPPPIDGLSIAPFSLRRPRTFRVKVPSGKQGGDTMTIKGGDELVFRTTVPYDRHPGDTFLFEYPGEVERVYATTLPSIPGMEVVQTKTIIFGSVSHAFFKPGISQLAQQSMGRKVGDLMQEAQKAILSQGILLDCNAVLGISFNVTSDSSEGRKTVIVTATGTPAIVVPSAVRPAVEADVILEPLYCTAVVSE